MKQFRVDEVNNKIELLDSRFYLHESGQLLPSVTTILDAYPKGPAFFEWLKVAGEKADEIRDQFGKRGSTVHALTERYDLGDEVRLMDGGVPQYSSLEWSMFERYVDFTKRFSPRHLMIEGNFANLKLGFGGTLDRITVINDRVTLIDIKTSNMLHNHFWLQMAAYNAMYDLDPLGAATHGKVEDVAILHLNSKHRTEGKGDAIQGIGWALVRPEKTVKEYWELFKATHALWKIEMGSLKPKNTIYNLTHKKNGI